MPRRRNRTPLSKEQIQEIKQKRKNYKNRKRYKLRKMESFLVEYKNICKKYGCFIQSFYGSHISKQKQDEKIYTIKSHLESIRNSLNKEY